MTEAGFVSLMHRIRRVFRKVIRCVTSRAEAQTLADRFSGQKAAAKLRLNWDKQYIINRIWLFDRPNTHTDQITSGRLTFSDGSTIKVGELPDDASAAKEVTFSPRKVD